MEIWKDIEGTEGQYQISNKGRARSQIILKDGSIKSTMLKYQRDKKGYCRLRVTIAAKKYGFKIHREVAKAFIPNPEEKPQVNHIDGNKGNNRVENLEWVTNSENCKHAIDNGLWENQRNADRKKRPIMAINIETGETISFESVSEAEKKLNTRHISAVLNGKRTKAKGYTFQEKGVV